MSQARTPNFETVDVVIIGAGVVGCAISARLSSTSASVALVEATSDVANGASKANAGVAASHYDTVDSLDNSLIRASNPRWEELCRRLDVPYRRVGAVIVGLTEEDSAYIEDLHQGLESTGVRSGLLTGAEVRDIEPLVTDRAVCGLSLPDEGIIDPMRLTVGYASLAAINGTKLFFDEPVIALESDGEVFRVTTARRTLRARFVVNAAGLGMGRLSASAGGEDFKMWPRRGEYLVLDREFGRRLNGIVFCTPSQDAKGVNVVPTTHGSVLVGPSNAEAEHVDPATHNETLDAVFEAARRLIPSMSREWAIKSFAGSRPASDERFRLRFDTNVPRLLHAGSRSVGVSSSPALADHAVQLLREGGLDVPDRTDAVNVLPAVPRLRTSAQPEELAAIDPGYGQVVCACEHVTAAEIRASLNSPCPARSIEGIRKRTGATYGRCQGAICMVGVSFMCATRYGLGPSDVEVSEHGSIGGVG